MTSDKGGDYLINTLIKKKVKKKGFLNMVKISSWHFRHLLYVVWLKKASKRGGDRHPRTPLAMPMDINNNNNYYYFEFLFLFYSNLLIKSEGDVTVAVHKVPS